MRPVYTSLEDMKTEPIVLGYVGENEHTSVFFDCTEIFAQYPDATPRLMVEPPKGDDYPSITYRQDNFVVWPVTDSDLLFQGNGRCQIEFVETRSGQSSIVAKTPRARTKIMESIVATGEIPTPVQQWVDRADEKLEEVDHALRTFPAGGNQGAVLTKASDDDYDTEWQEVDLSGKADKADTVLDTTLSRGRDATSTVGAGSFAFGNNVEASGSYSHAAGVDTSANGYGSHAEGRHTEANHAYQHVFGTYNKPDLSNNPGTEKGNYVEIVGNGTIGSNKNNARTLDWNGNEYLNGTLYVRCNADSSGGTEVATKVVVETVTGTTPSITGVDNHRYVCGEVSTLSITAPGTGAIEVIFESGSTATVLTTSGIIFPSWFDPTDLEADTTYEINVLDGRGVVMAWN